MSKKENSRKNAKLNHINARLEDVGKDISHIAFNFSYFSSGDEGGEDFTTWEQEKILADLNQKLVDYSMLTPVELMNNGRLERFAKYPQDSCFSCPKALLGKEISWARLRITGERRLIGFFYNYNESIAEIKDKFFVVFWIRIINSLHHICIIHDLL